MDPVQTNEEATVFITHEIVLLPEKSIGTSLPLIPIFLEKVQIQSYNEITAMHIAMQTCRHSQLVTGTR